MINGANEGQAGVIGFFILTAFTGNCFQMNQEIITKGTQFWTKEILFLKANEWVVIAFLGMAIVTYVTK